MIKSVDHIELNKNNVLEDMGTALDLYEQGLIYKSSRYENVEQTPVFKLEERLVRRECITDVVLNNCEDNGISSYELILYFVSGGNKSKLVFTSDKEFWARSMFDRIKNWLLG